MHDIVEYNNPHVYKKDVNVTLLKERLYLLLER